MIEWCNENWFLAFLLMCSALIMAYTLMHNLLVVINNLVACLFKRGIKKKGNKDE